MPLEVNKNSIHYFFSRKFLHICEKLKRLDYVFFEEVGCKFEDIIIWLYFEVDFKILRGIGTSIGADVRQSVLDSYTLVLFIGSWGIEWHWSYLYPFKSQVSNFREVLAIGIEVLQYIVSEFLITFEQFKPEE